jgi:G3E family GTPase
VNLSDANMMQLFINDIVRRTMIDLILLTGFLGAGKTTLMTSILDNYKDIKVGVIINEFGSVNIDARLIQRDGIQLKELSNGSIFCACIKDNFLASLIELSKLDLDAIYIEASGLADPANMTQILTAISSKLGRPYNYKGAICITDAENFIDLYDLLPALHHQIVYSSVAIINKADLASSDRIQETADKILEINPSAEIYITSFCRVDIKTIIHHMMPVRKEAAESTNTVESRPKTFVLQGTGSIPMTHLKAFMLDICQESYRIKGFALTDQGPMEISAVGCHAVFTPWPETMTVSEVVVISKVGIRMLSILTAAVDKHVKGLLHF